MFFNINEDALRRLQEQAKAAAKKEVEEPGHKILQHADGAIVIDDPSLVKVISVTDGSPTQEELDKFSFWHGVVGWVPLSHHPLWATFFQPQHNSSTTKEQL